MKHLFQHLSGVPLCSSAMRHLPIEEKALETSIFGIEKELDKYADLAIVQGHRLGGLLYT